MNKSLAFQEIRTYARNVGLSSTIHGIPMALRADLGLLKYMWIISTLVSAALCSYLICISIVEYFQYGVVSRIDDIKSTPIAFPTVAICNLNLFATKYALDFLNLTLESYLKNSFARVSADDIEADLEYFGFVRSLVIYNMETMKLNDSQKKAFGLSLDEMVLRCEFNSYPCDLENDFSWHFSKEHGNCYRFNSGMNMKGQNSAQKSQIRNGRENGLQIELFVGNKMNLLDGVKTKGVRVFVTNDTMSMTSTNSLDLSTGILADVSLNLLYTVKLPSPFSNCIANKYSINEFDSDLYRATFKYASNYRATVCENLCFQKHLTKECGCESVNYERLSMATDLCNTRQELECMNGIAKSFSTHFYQDCRNNCPDPCWYSYYTFDTVFNKFPSESYERFLMKRHKNRSLIASNSNGLRDDITALNVFFKLRRYQQITEIPSMSWLSTVSNIGGTIGLFLGCSFLSFIELIDLVIRSIHICMKRTGRVKQVQKPEKSSTLSQKSQILELNS